MRIVSWNINRNVHCVDYAFDYLSADVVMTQEGKMSDYPEVHAGGLMLMNVGRKGAGATTRFQSIRFRLSSFLPSTKGH